MKNKMLMICMALVLTLIGTVHAQEKQIEQAIKERIPDFPAINEIKKLDFGGLYEVRFNEADIVYADADGSHIFQGNIMETKTKANLTQNRIEQLTAIAFDKFPFKDSFKMVKGNGSRKLVVFEDPNCGYCKQFEKGLEKIDNLTMYVFMYPVLGPDSLEKAHNVWCSKKPAKTFSDWMINGVEIPKVSCDTSAVARNIEFGQKHKISGTPTLFFVGGKRVPGAIPAEQIETLLSEVTK